MENIPIRCQQHGISENCVRTTLQYGERKHWYHGSNIYYLSDRAMTAALTAEPNLRHWADRLVGTAVLTRASSGEVITAFKEKRGMHQIFNNYHGRSQRRTSVPEVQSRVDIDSTELAQAA